MDIYVSTLHVIVFLMGCAIIMYRFEIRQLNFEVKNLKCKVDDDKWYIKGLEKLAIMTDKKAMDLKSQLKEKS